MFPIFLIFSKIIFSILPVFLIFSNYISFTFPKLSIFLIFSKVPIFLIFSHFLFSSFHSFNIAIPTFLATLSLSHTNSFSPILSFYALLVQLPCLPGRYLLSLVEISYHFYLLCVLLPSFFALIFHLIQLSSNLPLLSSFFPMFQYYIPVKQLPVFHLFHYLFLCLYHYLIHLSPPFFSLRLPQGNSLRSSFSILLY